MNTNYFYNRTVCPVLKQTCRLSKLAWKDNIKLKRIIKGKQNLLFQRSVVSSEEFDTKFIWEVDGANFYTVLRPYHELL